MEDFDREIVYEAPPKRGLSVVELEALLSQWKDKLGMQDWQLSLKVVEFRRKNGYRQSGDFIADPDAKTATILMTWDPWRGDEEYTLVHELLHVLFYRYDRYSEELILKAFLKDGPEHGEYMDRLESAVHHITRIILGRSDR